MINDISSGLLEKNERRGLIRLRTLIILRWLAIGGQSIAIFIAAFVLDLNIELGLCTAAIGASIIINLIAVFVYPQNRRLLEREVFLTLLFDLIQLAFLLYLTGGLNNPFSLLILAPVTVSAMTLRPKSTALMGALAVILVSVLAVYYLPLRNDQGFVLRMPQLFIVGFWVALMIGIGFLGMYAWRVTAETYSMSQALLATQMALGREQKLTDLGGVVAAAAHELGTPLATIKLVSSELIEELEENSDLMEDAKLIRDQADRCRDILHSMGRRGKSDRHLLTAPISAVVEEAAEPHSDRGKEIEFTYEPREGGLDRMPQVQRRAEVIHGLRNLVQNAVDFADNQVWVDTRWSNRNLSIRVMDNGKGYPSELIGRIGDPFIGGRKRSEQQNSRPEYEGMGLGLFIAKTLLERSGAEVLFSNAADYDGSVLHGTRGAIAEVIWPIEALAPMQEGNQTGLGENQPIGI